MPVHSDREEAKSIVFCLAYDRGPGRPQQGYMRDALVGREALALVARLRTTRREYMMKRLGAATDTGPRRLIKARALARELMECAL